jgi:CubicO group peptidase (beta-lactamase class C family)
MGVAFALATLSGLPLAGQDFTAVEQSAMSEIVKLHIPGATIAIVRGDQVIFEKSFGRANIETGEAMRPEMLIRIGSTTKMFTAAALVGLAVEGKIDLNAPVGKYVAGLPPTISRLTANQLLSHTAGLSDDDPFIGLHDDSALGAGIHSWTDSWLFTDPDKVWSYASPGYWLAGYFDRSADGRGLLRCDGGTGFSTTGHEADDSAANDGDDSAACARSWIAVLFLAGKRSRAPECD